MNHADTPGESPRHTHIAVVLDRSGSMESIRDDVIGGFNAFLSAQQAEPGEATLTLVQFDSHDPYEVIVDHASLETVPTLTADTFVPRGSTPLLDAVGRTILETELWLSRQLDAKRPKHVVLMMITDGQENASTEFSLARVRHLIQAKEGLGWQVLFLSADLGAFDEAQSLGIAYQKRVFFSKNAAGNREAFARTSSKIAELRSGDVDALAYDDIDRAALSGQSKPS